MTKVSVVIPTYNREDIVSRAIDSVLEQTLSDVEVIVVDDASTDDTISVLESYNDQIEYYRHEENKGGSAARNTGIKTASGEYIAFLDADDEWDPAKLERQLETLEARSDEWVAVYCGIRHQRYGWTKVIANIVQYLPIIENETILREGGEELIKSILMGDIFHGGSSTLLVKTDVVRSINGFDESFTRHQDLEFLIRILKRGKLACVKEDLVTKYDTGRPSGADVEEAKSQYLSKFSDEINQLEREGFPITSIHKFDVARYYYESENFVRGTRFLVRSRPSEYQDILILLWSIIQGVSNRIIDVFSSIIKTAHKWIF